MTEPLTPETVRRLWVAVLLQAIRDVAIPKNTQGARGALRREAEAFFRGGGSFYTACDAAGLNPDDVQQAYREGRLHTVGRTIINFNRTVGAKGPKQ